MKVCVHYGCGGCAPPEWINFDSSPTLRFERIPIIGRLYTRNSQRFPENVRKGDIVAGLSVKEGTADLVYCSHVLEHLALDDFRTAVRNTWRMMKPGATFRLVVPDLEVAIRRYNESSDADAALRFLEDTLLGRKTRRRAPVAFVKEWLGGSKHLWMWDFKALEKELATVGFTEIRRAHFCDSGIPEFAKVEDESRWRGCLGVQCRRPAD